jgi:hypothetical protein
MFGSRPVIKIVVGNFLAAAVDAQILKIVVEEVSSLDAYCFCVKKFRSCSLRQSIALGSQVLGFPALLVYLDGDYEATWTALESGAVHIWPEVWRTEEGETRFHSTNTNRFSPASPQLCTLVQRVSNKR